MIIDKYKKKYKTATFSLEWDVLEELSEFSIESETKKSTIVEEALKEYIKRHRRKERAECTKGRKGLAYFTQDL